MNFATWAYRHSRSLLSLFAVLAIAGAACSLWLPVALFPQISFPRVRIDLDAGDRPAERMAIEVTTPKTEPCKFSSPLFARAVTRPYPGTARPGY
jgi:multidrug efflux pump subunit AcrB